MLKHIIFYPALFLLIFSGCGKNDKAEDDANSATELVQTNVDTTGPVFALNAFVYNLDTVITASYDTGHVASLKQYKGQYLVYNDSSQVELIHGNAPFGMKAFDITLWPTVNDYYKWYASSEYEPWLKMKHEHIKVKLGLLDHSLLADSLAEINADSSFNHSSAFVIFELMEIKDTLLYNEFFQGFKKLLADAGGRFLYCSPYVKKVEGGFFRADQRFLLLMPNAYAFKSLYNSEEFKPLKEILNELTEFNIILLDASLTPESYKGLPGNAI